MDGLRGKNVHKESELVKKKNVEENEEELCGIKCTIDLVHVFSLAVEEKSHRKTHKT